MVSVSRNIVAYFSHSGNTRVIANYIHEAAGGDIFEIEPVDPYPTDYNKCVEQARKELREEFKPELQSKVENMEDYDVVFVGYPNWWGTVPRPVAVFLSAYDFAGKTIVPFCTHGGSHLGRSVSDISGLCPQATILDGLPVRDRSVHKVRNEVTEWLRKIGIND
jgi:flavodoxin